MEFITKYFIIINGELNIEFVKILVFKTLFFFFFLRKNNSGRKYYSQRRFFFFGSLRLNIAFTFLLRSKLNHNAASLVK